MYNYFEDTPSVLEDFPGILEETLSVSPDVNSVGQQRERFIKSVGV